MQEMAIHSAFTVNAVVLLHFFLTDALQKRGFTTLFAQRLVATALLKRVKCINE